MSAQGATLRRGIAHMPIWPVAALVTVAAATLIGITLIDGARPQGIVTSVTQVERLANSSAAIREQGAALPVVWGTSHVTPSQTTIVGLENPSAYVTEAPAFAGFENPGAYVTEAPAFAGFENPGAYVTEAPAFAGFENPGAYVTEVPAAAGAASGIMVDGELCNQCR